MSELRSKTEQTYRVDIFVGGDLNHARTICKEYCMRFGLCVTIEPVSYIFTGGEEFGVRVGLLNYPRFPAEPEKIRAHAYLLGECLRIGLAQWSFLIVSPDQTDWYTMRPESEV